MSLGERLFLTRLRARDERAFQELVRDYGDRVFNLVLRMVGNRAEAEDIAQEVFVTVFKSIETFRGESRFSTWLLRIAANHSKNRIKYLARRATDKGDCRICPRPRWRIWAAHPPTATWMVRTPCSRPPNAAAS